MTNIEKLKELFPNYIGNLDFEILDKHGDVSDEITYIDVPENKIEYLIYFVAECGCCTDSSHETDDLDAFLEYMSDNDFNNLLKDLKKD